MYLHVAGSSMNGETVAEHRKIAIYKNPQDRTLTNPHRQSRTHLFVISYLQKKKMNDPLTPSPQTIYTESQLHCYLKHVEYPNSDVLPPPTLTTLQELMVYHLARVPFENLIIHYSSHHSVSLDPEHLYHKIVERGHGGYCMENTGCFSIVLRSLGFNLWNIGGKVSATLDTNGVDRDGGFRGW